MKEGDTSFFFSNVSFQIFYCVLQDLLCSEVKIEKNSLFCFVSFHLLFFYLYVAWNNRYELSTRLGWYKSHAHLFSSLFHMNRRNLHVRYCQIQKKNHQTHFCKLHFTRNIFFWFIFWTCKDTLIFESTQDSALSKSSEVEIFQTKNWTKNVLPTTGVISFI